MTNADDAWLTVEQIAERWGLSETFVRTRIKQGKLRASVIGGGPQRSYYRIRASEVDRYERENQT